MRILIFIRLVIRHILTSIIFYIHTIYIHIYRHIATNAIANEYSALTFELDKPDDDKEKSLVEKAIQCNIQKIIKKYNKTSTNQNKDIHLNGNQMCSDPIQYHESQFCIEVIINYEF